MNQQFAAKQDTQHLLCRNLRHSWKINQFRAVDHEEAKAQSLLKWDQVIVRELTCTRCDTVKREYFARDKRSHAFTRAKGGYHYPKEYLFHGSPGEERPDRWDYFGELYNRL